MAEQTGNTSSNGGAQGASTQQTVTTQGAGGATASTFEARREAVSGLVDSLLRRHGTPERALDVLGGENHDYREQLRISSARVTELERNQIPAEGVVLTGDERKTWERYKALNLPIDKVEERIKKAGELEASFGKEQTLKLVGDAAKAAKFNADVLAPLLDSNQLDVEVRSTTVRDGAGKESQEPTAYVRKRGDQNATWEKLHEFAERDGSPLKAFLPALKTGVGSNGSSTQGAATGNTGNGSSTQGAATGNTGNGSSTQGVTHSFPNTTGSASHGDGGSGNVADTFLKNRNDRAGARTNPLRPATETKK